MLKSLKLKIQEIKKEELYNTSSHFIGLILSIIGAPVLFYYDQHLTFLSTWSIIFYVFGLILVYLASSLYHFTTNPILKEKFRIFDHISIYYLIAGSYAPVCLITLYDGQGLFVFLTVTALALFGTVFKIFLTGRFESLFLLLYLVMGWLIVFEFNNILLYIDLYGIYLMVLGGVCYTLGVIFYSLDKLKYSHTIWHLFVLIGSISHYFMILFYVII
jgi:hemolysin III